MTNKLLSVFLVGCLGLSATTTLLANTTDLPKLALVSNHSNGTSSSYGAGSYVIPTAVKGKFLYIGNFEKLLIDSRIKYSDADKTNSAPSLGGESAKNASQMTGAITQQLNGKRTVKSIDSFAYDARMDISILSIPVDDTVFEAPTMGNPSDKAYLRCNVAATFKEPPKTKFIALNVGRKDLRLTSIAKPQIEAKPETNGFNPSECIVTNKNGGLLGIIRQVNLKEYFSDPIQDVTVIYQPIEPIMLQANELASNGKISRATPNIGTIVPGRMTGHSGLLLIGPSHAEFKSGDILIKLEGKNLNEPSDIANILELRKPGDKVTFKVARGSRLYDIDVFIEEESLPYRGDSQEFKAPPAPK